MLLLSMCVAHAAHVLYDKYYDDMLIDDHDNDPHILRDESIVPEPTASTSSVPSQASSVVSTGSELLEKTLLGRYSSGLVASPFLDVVKKDSSKLQHLLSLHGIVSHGFSAEDCRVVLLHHLFSGSCVSSQHPSRDRTGCILFSRGFESAAEMFSGAFSILSSATVGQRSNDDLLYLLQDLKISSNFRVRNICLQIVRELRRQAKTFFSLKSVCLTEDVFFVGFECHSQAMLLAFASAHGINVDRYTSTISSLKDAIMVHFATAGCFTSLLSHTTSTDLSSLPLLDGCQNTCASVKSGCWVGAGSQSEFLLQWLNQQRTKLTRLPLQHLLNILEIKYQPTENVRQLWMLLKNYTSGLRTQLMTSLKGEDGHAEQELINEKLENIR